MRHYLKKNLTILGAPGSGKGFYGRPLADYLGLRHVTASKILQEQRPDLDLTSGELIDDRIVADALQSHLTSLTPRQHYLLDGYPRTLDQIQLMEHEWPIDRQVHFCLQLDIPDFVCQTKMLGRRQCRRCRGEYNVAGVQQGGFDLPPQLPGQDGGRACDQDDCHPETDWIAREDDTPSTIAYRLARYREHEAAIADYYRRQGRLLSFTPYRGQLDIDKLNWTVEKWLQTFD